MIEALKTTLRRSFVLAAFGGIFCAILGFATPADARVWIGFGFPGYYGPPAYYPPPVYYPPPAYYPPPPYYPSPPAYYPPAQYTPSQGTAPSGQTCTTGATVCPMDHPVPTGSSCYCTTAQGRSWGRAN
jgi:hypothetical protein